MLIVMAAAPACTPASAVRRRIPCCVRVPVWMVLHVMPTVCGTGRRSKGQGSQAAAANAGPLWLVHLGRLLLHRLCPWYRPGPGLLACRRYPAQVAGHRRWLAGVHALQHPLSKFCTCMHLDMHDLAWSFGQAAVVASCGLACKVLELSPRTRLSHLDDMLICRPIKYTPRAVSQSASRCLVAMHLLNPRPVL